MFLRCLASKEGVTPIHPSCLPSWSALLVLTKTHLAEKQGTLGEKGHSWDPPLSRDASPEELFYGETRFHEDNHSAPLIKLGSAHRRLPQLGSHPKATTAPGDKGSCPVPSLNVPSGIETSLT